MKKISILLMTILLMVFSLNTQAQAVETPEETLLIINNQPYTFLENEPPMEMIEGRFYLPLRVISVALNHQITWVSETNQVAIWTKDTTPSALATGNLSGGLEIVIDGEILTIPADMGAPYVKDEGHTMIPLRAIGDALDCQVIWEPGVVILKENPKTIPTPFPTPIAPIVSSNNALNDAITNPMHALTIAGPSLTTQAQIEQYLVDKMPDIKLMLAKNYPGRAYIPLPENIVGLYLEIGRKYNIRGDLAFAQALKETGYFQFYGSVQPFQNNYCGLGATGQELTGEEPLNGVDPLRAFYIPTLHGLSFATPRDGVEAHIQHLYAYACSEELPAGTTLVDPRFKYLKRGICPRWIDLNGRWAVPGDGYGQSVIDDYWSPALSY